LFLLLAVCCGQLRILASLSASPVLPSYIVLSFFLPSRRPSRSFASLSSFSCSSFLAFDASSLFEVGENLGLMKVMRT
jgi:hypothetical protein